MKTTPISSKPKQILLGILRLTSKATLLALIALFYGLAGSQSQAIPLNLVRAANGADFGASSLNVTYDSASAHFLAVGTTTAYDFGSATLTGFGAYSLAATITSAGLLTSGTLTINGDIGSGVETLLTGNLRTGANGTAYGVVEPPSGSTELGNYSQWAVQNFGAAGASNPALSGIDADPDGDGLSNWQEWRDGSNPVNAGSFRRDDVFEFNFTVSGGKPGIMNDFGGHGATGGIVLEAWFRDGGSAFNGWEGSFNYNDSQNSFANTFEPVPEPSSIVLLLLGGSLCMVVRRRARSWLAWPRKHLVTAKIRSLR